MAGGSKKKEAILDAMLDLVVERGFHDAPMSLLAKRSGASPGVIYHYFKNKDDLILALYLRIASVKREAFLTGYSEDMAPREALLHVWLNAYRFFRTYRKETRFLDQYLNSPYCKAAANHEPEKTDVSLGRIMKMLRSKKKGGVLKNLPSEAIDGLTLGLAARLAKADKTFSEPKLTRIAEAVWEAIADE